MYGPKLRHIRHFYQSFTKSVKWSGTYSNLLVPMSNTALLFLVLKFTDILLALIWKKLEYNSRENYVIETGRNINRM